MKLFFWTNSGNLVNIKFGMPIRILQKEPSAFAILGVLRLISFMGLLEHPNDQKRLSRKRPKQFDLLRRGFGNADFRNICVLFRKSQKNLAS